MQKVEEAQCRIPGLCDKLEGATLRRSWTDPAAVQAGTLELAVQSANATQVVVRAVYKERGTPIEIPIFIVLEDQEADVSCVQSLNGVARLLTCTGPLAMSVSMLFSASAPNLIAVESPLSAAVTFTCKCRRE